MGRVEELSGCLTINYSATILEVLIRHIVIYCHMLRNICFGLNLLEIPIGSEPCVDESANRLP